MSWKHMWEIESHALYKNTTTKGGKMRVPRYILILGEKSGNKYNAIVIILQKDWHKSLGSL